MHGRQHRGVHPPHVEPLAHEAREHREGPRVARFPEAQGELNLHPRILFGGRGGQGRLKQGAAFIPGKPGIGELQRLNPHGRLVVAEETVQVGWRERAELLERAQRDDDGGWFEVSVGKQSTQHRRGLLFSAFDQQTLRGLAPPEERAGTFAGQSLRIEPAHVSGGRGRSGAVGEAINAAPVVPSIDAVLLLEMPRNGRVILDDFPVVVRDPDGTIRPVSEVHGMTPGVGARGEFGSLLAGCASRFQHRTIGFDERPVDEISRGFTDEILPAQFRQHAVLIHHRAARGRKPSGGLALRRAIARVVVFEIRRIVGALLPPRMRLRN